MFGEKGLEKIPSLGGQALGPVVLVPGHEGVFVSLCLGQLGLVVVVEAPLGVRLAAIALGREATGVVEQGPVVVGMGDLEALVDVHRAEGPQGVAVVGGVLHGSLQW